MSGRPKGWRFWGFSAQESGSESDSEPPGLLSDYDSESESSESESESESSESESESSESTKHRHSLARDGLVRACLLAF